MCIFVLNQNQNLTIAKRPKLRCTAWALALELAAH